jgi:hypothetical protein
MAPVFAQTAPPCLSKWPSRSSSTPAKVEAGVIGSLSACEPVMPAATGLHRLGQTCQTPPASCKPWSRTIGFTHQDQPSEEPSLHTPGAQMPRLSCLDAIVEASTRAPRQGFGVDDKTGTGLR